METRHPRCWSTTWLCKTRFLPLESIGWYFSPSNEKALECTVTGNNPYWSHPVPNAYEVKALSPHHRFVIALHSPGGVAETGLRVCPPEKNARKSAADVRRATFSGTV